MVRRLYNQGQPLYFPCPVHVGRGIDGLGTPCNLVRKGLERLKEML